MKKIAIFTSFIILITGCSAKKILNPCEAKKKLCLVTCETKSGLEKKACEAKCYANYTGCKIKEKAKKIID